MRPVGESGLISQAARAAKVSYQAAWQAIDTLTNHAGMARVERAVGWQRFKKRNTRVSDGERIRTGDHADRMMGQKSQRGRCRHLTKARIS